VPVEATVHISNINIEGDKIEIGIILQLQIPLPSDSSNKDTTQSPSPPQSRHCRIKTHASITSLHTHNAHHKCPRRCPPFFSGYFDLRVPLSRLCVTPCQMTSQLAHLQCTSQMHPWMPTPTATAALIFSKSFCGYLITKTFAENTVLSLNSEINK
jgi:hypothetical protein